MNVRDSILITVIFSMVHFTEQYPDINDIASAQLHKKLMSNYVKQVPVVNYDDTLHVYTFMRLFELLELDSSSEIMSVTAEFIFNWDDAFLRWSPVEYPGVLSLSFPANQVSTL